LTSLGRQISILRVCGPKWHTLISSGRQISILRVRGPKWHRATSLRAAGVFNSNIFAELEYWTPLDVLYIQQVWELESQSFVDSLRYSPQKLTFCASAAVCIPHT
jgi:hypothetical protein